MKLNGKFDSIGAKDFGKELRPLPDGEVNLELSFKDVKIALKESV